MAVMQTRIGVRAFLIATLAVVGLSGDEGLVNVVMFEDTAIQKAVPGIRERFAWPSSQEIEATAAQPTPRLESIRRDCERVLSLVFAPEALPKGVQDQMLTLRTKDGDRVRLSRFEYKGWVVDASIWYPTVDLAVKAGNPGLQAPQDLVDYVLSAARDLMVGDKSRVSEIKLFGAAETTTYGLQGYLKPVLRSTEDHIVMERRLYDRWPGTFGFLTDGESIRFILPRPPASPSQKRQSDLSRVLLKEWFTKTESDVPWHE
jgi:hypothetical protein